MNKQINILGKKILAFITSFILVAGITGVSVAVASITFSNSTLTGDSAFTNFTGATSTVFDVGANNTFSLQTTNNGPVTFGAGLTTISGGVTLGNSTAKAITFNGTIVGSSPLVFSGAVATGTTATTFSFATPSVNRSVQFLDQGGSVPLSTSNNLLFFTNTAASSTNFIIPFAGGEIPVATNNNTLFLTTTASSTTVTVPTSGTLATLANTETLTNKTLISPRIGSALLDSAGNALLGVAPTASAVNSLFLTNAATGNNPTVSATGTDVTIGMTFNTKALGAFNFSNASNTIQIAPASGGAASFAGTLTSAALTSARSWIFQDSPGEVPLSTSNNTLFFTTTASTTGVTLPTSGTLATLAGTETLTNKTITATALSTTSNCSSSASPAVCGSAPSGSVAVPIGAIGTTLTVNTTAVTANSQIFVQEDSSLGTRLSVTCNTQGGRTYAVTTRTAATSFVITASTTAVTTNPACLSYFIVN